MDVHQKRDVVVENQSKSPINSSSSCVISSSSSPDPTSSNDNNNGNVEGEGDDINGLFDPVSKYPAGYRFQPTDEELVGYYLKKKVANQKLPINMRNNVELYKHNPQYLPQGDSQWYFFTPRDRKYPNGERPNRAAGDGFWKATGADKLVMSNKDKIGFRKALVFYKGKPPNGDKTDWIMHEYRLNEPPKKRITTGTDNDMRLDDWVLCRVYKKKADRSPSKINARKTEDDHGYKRHAKKSATNQTLTTSSSNQNHNIYHHHMLHAYPEFQCVVEPNNHHDLLFMNQPSTHLGHPYLDIENSFKVTEPSPLIYPFIHSTEKFTTKDHNIGYQHDDGDDGYYSLSDSLQNNAIPSMTMDSSSFDQWIMKMDNTNNAINSSISHAASHGNDSFMPRTAGANAK
ncbi:NAC transcription factor 25 [Ziziphus jujuba]|uniref:NAC transcription factor 25 n=1 Tax=Ziziphus jujuba TaxID=326968 RepID=A0ABM3I1N3_ZIZJJ|nr:NAC transcription factor 25 [Ziziphus jujuba]